MTRLGESCGMHVVNSCEITSARVIIEKFWARRGALLAQNFSIVATRAVRV